MSHAGAIITGWTHGTSTNGCGTGRSPSTDSSAGTSCARWGRRARRWRTGCAHRTGRRSPAACCGWSARPPPAGSAPWPPCSTPAAGPWSPMERPPPCGASPASTSAPSTSAGGEGRRAGPQRSPPSTTPACCRRPTAGRATGSLRPAWPAPSSTWRRPCTRHGSSWPPTPPCAWACRGRHWSRCSTRSAPGATRARPPPGRCSRPGAAGGRWGAGWRAGSCASSGRPDCPSPVARWTSGPATGWVASILYDDARLVVEIDGGWHHEGALDVRRDKRRSAALAAAGFRVLPLAEDLLRRDPAEAVRLVSEARRRARRATG